MHKKNIVNLFLKSILIISATIVVITLATILGYIIISGAPYLNKSLFSLEYNSENVSALPALINTIIIIAFTLIIAVPIGIGSAIYLVEYSKKSSKIIKLIRLTTETLSGIPSIVYGLFGMLMFVTYFKLGYSLVAGVLTLSIIILPIIIITTEEALHSVPNTLREASLGLGAGKFKTIYKIVLPHAKSGIVGGVMLSIGRIVGESAALIFTAGTVASIPLSDSSTPFFMQSTRTMSVHMYLLSGEGLHMNEAKATAVILLLLVLVINAITIFATRKDKI